MVMKISQIWGEIFRINLQRALPFFSEFKYSQSLMTYTPTDKESKHYTFALQKHYTVVFGVHCYGTNCFLLLCNKWDLS